MTIVGFRFRGFYPEDALRGRIHFEEEDDNVYDNTAVRVMITIGDDVHHLAYVCKDDTR